MFVPSYTTQMIIEEFFAIIYDQLNEQIYLVDDAVGAVAGGVVGAANW